MGRYGNPNSKGSAQTKSHCRLTGLRNYAYCQKSNGSQPNGAKAE